MVLTTPPVRGVTLVIVAARAGEKAPPDYGDSSQWAGRAVIVRRRRARPASPGTARTRGRPGRRRTGSPPPDDHGRRRRARPASPGTARTRGRPGRRRSRPAPTAA